MKKITTFIGALMFAAITVSAFANAKHRVLPQVFYQSGTFCLSAFAEVCETTGDPICEKDLFSDEAGNTPLGINAQIYQNQLTPSQCDLPYRRTTK